MLPSQVLWKQSSFAREEDVPSKGEEEKKQDSDDAEFFNYNDE